VGDKDYPRFEAGQKLSDLNARQLNNLVDSVRRLDSLKAGRGIAIADTPNGVTISLDPGDPNIMPPDKWCVVVEPIEEGHTSMVARAVKYADPVPVVGSYEYDGPEFDAFPAFGYAVEDYINLVWEPDEGADVKPPDESAVFIRAFRNSDQWLLEMPSGDVRPVVVRQIPDLEADYIMVQRVRQSLTDAAVFHEYGDMFAMPVMPHAKAFDYVGYVFAGPVNETAPLPLSQIISGAYRVTQTLLWTVGDEPPGEIISCQVSA